LTAILLLYCQSPLAAEVEKDTADDGSKPEDADYDAGRDACRVGTFLFGLGSGVGDDGRIGRCC
jgi:hypothetical protein